MNYGAYTDFKWAGEQDAIQREADQRRIFEAADVLFAVGPLLRDSLRRLIDRPGVRIVQLVPGLDDDLLQREVPPGPFRAVVFGRLGPEDDPIKQGRLAVAALSSAVASTLEVGGDGLLANLRPEIDVVGLESHNAEVFRGIQQLAQSYVRGGPWPLPRPMAYTEDRDALRRILRNAHVAIMPSWHEGFGLVGWEAIAAAVPLLLSRSTGLFQLIQECGNIYTDDVASFRVAGQVPTEDQPEPFTPLDVQEVAQRFVQVASAHGDWKERAVRLRGMLSRYTWQCTAETLLSALVSRGLDSAVTASAQPQSQAAGPPVSARQSLSQALQEKTSPGTEPSCHSTPSLQVQGAEAVVPLSGENPILAFPDRQVASGLAIDELIGCARQLRLGEEFAGARSALDQASRLIGLPPDPIRSGYIAREMGIIERIQGNLTLARTHFIRALDALPETEGIARADAQLQFGILLRQQDDRTMSRRELKRAREAFKQLSNRNGEGHAALELAELARLEGDYGAALALLNEAGTAFEATQDRRGLAEVERITGSIERLRDRPRDAVQHLVRAQQEYEAISSHLGLALTLFELAETRAQLGQYDQTAMLHRRAMDLSDDIGFQSGVRNGHLALANLAARQNRLDEAVNGFRRALDYAQSVRDLLGEMQARAGLASVLIPSGDDAEAAKQLQVAYDQAFSLRDTGLRSEIRFHQALLELRAKAFDAAAGGFREAFTLGQEAQDIAAQGRALHGLGDTLGLSGAMTEAADALQRARRLLKQASRMEDAAIAGLSLASIRVATGDRASCELLRTVARELRQLNRLDMSQKAQELLDRHCQDA